MATALVSIVSGQERRVLAALGGASLPGSLLGAWAGSATFVAAADGGADALLAAGVVAELVVGDLDSLQADRALFPEVCEEPSQETTDCDKLLAALSARGYREATLVNVEGGLPDHGLAILLSVAKGPVACRLVYNRGFGYVVAGPDRIAVMGAGRVSLLPLTQCAGVSLTGVRWPLQEADLHPLGLASVSNEAVGGPIEVAIASGVAFLFTEADITPNWPA